MGKSLQDIVCFLVARLSICLSVFYLIFSCFPLGKFLLALLALIIFPDFRYEKPGKRIYDALRKLDVMLNAVRWDVLFRHVIMLPRNATQKCKE